jgi:hypothetical protein
MKNRNLILLLVTTLLVSRTLGQATDAVLRTYATQYEQERVHMHFDKDAYLPGETVWMKAYIMAGARPSDISHNIYFDLSDSHGQLLAHTVSPVTEGTASASFSIPASLRDGAIHIKAYTKWMLNFDSGFLYNKDISVLTQGDGTSFGPERYFASIRFFPEGGELVSGLANEVAFEILDQQGHPVDARGIIKNGQGLVIDSFATVHEGMGVLRISPLPTDKYTAFWKDEYGQSHATELPTPKAQGANLLVHTSGPEGMVSYRLQRTSDCQASERSLTLVGTIHQAVVYKSTQDLRDKTWSDQTIDTRSMPSGVMQLTLFDSAMNPLAERVVFVNKNRASSSYSLIREHTSFTKRGQNTFSIEVPDSLGTDLSVSVTDGGLGFDTSTNIISDLLLTSDLRGHVSNPAWYFSNNSDSAAIYLDLVMRTHGWRRFAWREAIAGKFPVIQFAADSDFMAISGKIDQAAAPFEAGDSISLLILTKDHKKHVISLPISPQGTFVQKGVFFYDTLQMVYRLNHPAKISAASQITIQTNLGADAGKPTAASSPDFEWNRVPDVVMEKELDGSILETNSYAKQAPGMDYTLTPGPKLEGPRPGYETASHYLQDNFPELRFATSAKEHSGAPGSGLDNRFASYSPTSATAASVTATAKSNVSLLLDGNLVTIDDLKQLNMKDVLYIKFLQKNSPKDIPALAITSKQSIDQDNIANNKTGFAVVTGYAPEREFYAPLYAGTSQDDQAADYRSTLYWNPRLVFDKNHRKISISFNNNDLSNKFRIVVEGFNREGRLIRMDDLVK